MSPLSFFKIRFHFQDFREYKISFYALFCADFTQSLSINYLRVYSVKSEMEK